MIEDAPPESAPRVWRWLVPLVLVAAAGFALHSPWLSLHEVEILGSVRSDPAAGVAKAGVGEGAILVWIDTGAVADQVRRDPWVADARVTRVWPDRLVVEVIERTPVIWIEGFTSWMLVAGDGTIVQVAPAPEGGYLRAAVPFADMPPGSLPVDPIWGELVAFAVVLRDDIGGALTVETRGTEVWTEVFGHPVRLGNPIDLADKARTLRALLGEAPPGSTIDVSSPVRPVVIPSQDGVEGSGAEA